MSDGMFTFGGSGSSGSGVAPRLSWGQMSETQKIAHSLKHGTKYATNADAAALAQAQRYLERDARPATDNGNQDNLAQLYAEENTRAQQQQQATTNPYGLSNAQLTALQGYYDKGIIDPNTNQLSAEYLANPANNDNLYDLYIHGFGLGKTDLQAALRAQAGAGWEALNQSDEPYDSGGLTFGGGSGSGYQPPPPPPPGQEELFNPTQEAGPVRSRNFQTVDYSTQGAATPVVNTGIGTAGQAQATPWADAYLRAQQASAKQGPISGLFSKEMENS
jgi:hypothetical protein